MKNQKMHYIRTIALTLAGFALSMTAWAADGGLPNQNTAEGHGALISLTTGANNTAVGFDTLFSITDGSEDTATGSLALANDTGGFNAAFGFSALNANTTGQFNTAIGRNAMFTNTTGANNTATGGAALFSNTTGNFNTASGRGALFSNTKGSGNTANGFFSLFNNKTAEQNTANGVAALFNNTTGEDNIALGFGAGDNITTGDNNIDIGNLGVATESNTVRIGEQVTITDPNTGDRMPAHTRTFIAGIRGRTTGNGDAIPVVIDSAGQLGTMSSSRRFKKEIKPMDQTSEAILGLKPVTFRYKKDNKGEPQFGLIAEEVAKVNPDLVVRDAQGEIYTVRYDAVNAMLLNEFLKEHKRVEQQEATIAQLESTVAQQQKGMAALAASLKEQAAQIQKVSAQLRLSKPAPRLLVNNQ
jgi:hypothetical protein